LRSENIGAYITVALLALVLGMGIDASMQQPQQAPRINAQQKAERALKNKQNADKRTAVANSHDPQAETQHRGEEGTEFWPPFLGWRFKVTDSMLVLFTFVLAVFTGFLWKSTDKLGQVAMTQGIDLKRSVTAAEIAAKAADLSARAAIGVELPSLHVEEVLTSFELCDDVKDWVHHLVPHVKVKNYGRTPAFVTEVLINSAIERGLPKQAVYKSFSKYNETRKFVIHRDEETTLKTHSYYKENVFSDERIALLTEDDPLRRHWLYIFGVIRYRDFLDEAEHERGFLFMWISQNKAFAPIYDNEYYYQRRREEPF
jgi:hypothetical protein